MHCNVMLRPLFPSVAIRPGETILASIMGVNNEIGVIQPLKEIGQVPSKRHPLVPLGLGLSLSLRGLLVIYTNHVHLSGRYAG